MSTTYSLVCDECKEKLWIGQNQNIYSTQKHIHKLTEFLYAHEGHSLRFLSQHSEPLDYIEFVSANDEGD